MSEGIHRYFFILKIYNLCEGVFLSITSAIKKLIYFGVLKAMFFRKKFLQIYLKTNTVLEFDN